MKLSLPSPVVSIADHLKLIRRRDLVVVSENPSGMYARVGKMLGKRPASWTNPVPRAEWLTLIGDRNATYSPMAQGRPAAFHDIYWQTSTGYASHCRLGETIHYRIVHDGTTYRTFVHRITNLSPCGTTIELSYKQLQARCESKGWAYEPEATEPFHYCDDPVKLMDLIGKLSAVTNNGLNIRVETNRDEAPLFFVFRE